MSGTSNSLDKLITDGITSPEINIGAGMSVGLPQQHTCSVIAGYPATRSPSIYGSETRTIPENTQCRKTVLSTSLWKTELEPEPISGKHPGAKLLYRGMTDNEFEDAISNIERMIKPSAFSRLDKTDREYSNRLMDYPRKRAIRSEGGRFGRAPKGGLRGMYSDKEAEREVERAEEKYGHSRQGRPGKRPRIKNDAGQDLIIKSSDRSIAVGQSPTIQNSNTKSPGLASSNNTCPTIVGASEPSLAKLPTAAASTTAVLMDPPTRERPHHPDSPLILSHGSPIGSLGMPVFLKEHQQMTARLHIQERELAHLRHNAMVLHHYLGIPYRESLFDPVTRNFHRKLPKTEVVEVENWRTIIMAPDETDTESQFEFRNAAVTDGPDLQQNMDEDQYEEWEEDECEGDDKDKDEENDKWDQ